MRVKENLVRGFPVETFSRGVIESSDDRREVLGGDVGQSSFFGEELPEETIGVFDSQ